MPVLKMCKDGCGRSVIAWDTITNRCAKCTEKRRKERSKAKEPKPLKRSTKPIRKESKKKYKTRRRVRRDWFEANPPSHQGYWECYLQISPDCCRWLTEQTITLEHVEPKVKRPDLIFEVTNLKPACDPCNALKGSQSLEKVREKYGGKR